MPSLRSTIVINKDLGMGPNMQGCRYLSFAVPRISEAQISIKAKTNACGGLDSQQHL